MWRQWRRMVWNFSLTARAILPRLAVRPGGDFDAPGSLPKILDHYELKLVEFHDGFLDLIVLVMSVLANVVV